MIDPQQTLSDRFQRAITAAFGDQYAATDPLIRPAQNPRFGDYQANVAMSLGKRLGRPPREVAAAILEHLDAQGVCEVPEIAGPGFINLRLTPECLSRVATALAADERLGVEPIREPGTVVVDYSSPNVAKEMHVGHLRSTVIGDAIVRTLDFLGHRVIRQNHVGDWGTQFGMLIERMIRGETGGENHGQDGHATIPDLNAWYREAKAQFDADPEFADAARQNVVKLQAGDPGILRMWEGLIRESKRHFNEAYRRMNVRLTDADIRGESFYNPMLGETVEELGRAGLTSVSDGALCIFMEEFNGKEDEPLPLIIRKADGGYLYATTDLAAIRFRVRELGADRVIYVTDARQRQHFAMVFAAARKAGWVGDDVRLEHVPFGTILGEDQRPFKTRTGETVRLIDLLDEAERRAEAIVAEKNPDLTEAERKRVARVVGIGAVKYGDLSNDRVKDYVFSWPRMLAMDGNTAPYLQYAYARVRSIFRKAGGSGTDMLPVMGSGSAPHATQAAPRVEHAAERALVLKLAQFGPTVRAVADSLEPHRMCAWLYELAVTFSGFYENCPVLRAEDESRRADRLALCEVTARALRTGLDLLGIETLERM